MQIVILAIGIIAALAYFNIDLRTILGTIFGNPVVQTVWNLFVFAWTALIKPILIFIWAIISGMFQ